jgi:spore maturation protein CgeB
MSLVKVGPRELGDPKRILLVQPGASFSTDDVYTGYRDALLRRGHEVIDYMLDEHITCEYSRQLGVHRYGRSKGRRLLKAAQQSGNQDAIEAAQNYIDALPPMKPNIKSVIEEASDQVVLAVLKHLPHVVLIVSGMFLHPHAFIMLYRCGAPVCLVLTESPYDDEKQRFIAPYADTVFTNEKSSVALLRETGGSDGGPVERFGNPNTHYLAHAIDITRHQPGPLPGDETIPAHDVVFVGSGFTERMEILSQVDWSGIDLGLYGKWPYLGPRHPLRKYLRRPPGADPSTKLTASDLIVPNNVAAALYRRARIGLNLHRSSMGAGKNAPRITEAWSLNPRARELAAAGCFTVSDYRPEVEEVFKGIDYPTFRTPTELEQLIRRYLANDEARQRIAAQLPDAVVADTFDARVAQMESFLGRHSRVAA